MTDMSGYDYYNNVLGKPKLVLAPMVDQSELAWRMMARKYGAELCYSPMFHASVFIRDKQYREEALKTCKEDRPLIIQFCANDPNTLLQAGLLAQDQCDGIDLNLGCPQAIARKGHYGAFLQDEWGLIAKMVSICAENLKVPISCKIRVFKSLDKTIQYAQMLVKAGCKLLAVHGRRREQKGPETGLASWEYVKKIKEVVDIPVFSNGNIQYQSDVAKCLEETGVDGVMVAEGSLHNPTIFKNMNPICWEMADEYIEYAKKYNLKNCSIARGHIFKMCHHALAKHNDIRHVIANSKTLDELSDTVDLLKQTCLKMCQSESNNEAKEDLPFSHWICQPYVRPTTSVLKVQEKRKQDECEINDLNIISNKKRKRLIRKYGKNVPDNVKDVVELFNQYKDIKMNSKPKYNGCEHCGNPRGESCLNLLCKTCCKIRYKETENAIWCPQHSRKKRNHVKTALVQK